MRGLLITGLMSAVLAATLPAIEMPVLVGGMAHGADNIAILAELGLGNFVWIPPSYYYATGNVPWDDSHTVMHDIEACLAHDMYFMIGQRRGLGDDVRPGGFEYGGHGSADIYGEEEVRGMVEAGGRFFIGLHAGEMDADFIQSALRPSFRARTPELYAFTDRAGGRMAFEGELRRLTKRYHSYGARFVPNLCVTHHHCGFRAGAPLVVAELLEHLPTTELQLAYLRGGATQFSRPWGVWVSPWWWGTIPCEDKETFSSKHAVEGGGHPASALRRCLWLSYVSGARLFTAQETEVLYAKTDSGYRLAAWGLELKELWDYASAHHEPLRPIVNLALLIDADNGWAPAHMWQDWNQHAVVWGKLPLDRSDRMLVAYLNALLPGFERTRESVQARVDYFPGYFAATPSGPFDIVSSDISPEALAAYPAIALMGEVDFTPHLHETLRAYVDAGGALLINALHMRRGEELVQDEPWVGATIGTRVYPSDRTVVETPKRLVRFGFPPEKVEVAEPWFMSVEVSPTTAEVVVTDGDGRPVLLHKRHGEGRVLLSTPEYMSEGFGEQSRPLEVFSRLVGGIASAGPLAVEGSGISWIAAYRARGEVLVCLADHGGGPSNATVTWAGGAGEAVVEVGGVHVRTSREGDVTVYALQVPPEDVILLSFRTTR